MSDVYDKQTLLLLECGYFGPGTINAVAAALREQVEEIERLKNQRCENPTIDKEGNYTSCVYAHQLADAIDMLRKLKAAAGLNTPTWQKIDTCLQGLGVGGKPEPMTPEEFSKRMSRIVEQELHDTEVDHGTADDLLIEALESLGYTDGILLYRDLDKWYA